MAGQIRVGMSGWKYEPWRGNFYPKGVTQKRELEHASRQVTSLEINGTFYSLQSPKSFTEWHDQTPDDFVFSLKGSQFLTHIKRLKDFEQGMANFFASGMLTLKEKLGPFLWQLPPNMKWERDRLEPFLDALPRDTEAMATIAATNNIKKPGGTFFDADKKRPLRHAIEVRHPTFQDPEFIDLLRKNNVALVVADSTRHLPPMEDVTADFIYVRMHGDIESHPDGYTDADLRPWVKRIDAWRKGGELENANKISPAKARKKSSRDVFVYFDTENKLRAPHDAMRLLQLMK